MPSRGDRMIDIPGYRIVRQLGRGGMATVWLAIQESVDREVALKVMSPALLADPSYGERFLREARIAAKLHHRHVVGVHDVGRAGDYHYIAMEYLPNGPILGRGDAPRDVAFALRVTREISTALAYAHAKGFVHRDVKPDNILLRDDGSAALADFGIARASDSATRMTKTGAVVGTPHYMSPEQARGRPIDGRADLYSLGIVLHEMLTGRVPYAADDSLAVGIMHITEPVPTLPPPYGELQMLLDRLLAKQPEHRYQNGDEVALAVQELEFALATGQLRSLPIPGDEARRRILDSTPLPRATPVRVEPEPAATRTGDGDDAPMRAEPRIGRIDDSLLAGARPRRMREAPPERRGVVRGLVIGVVLLLVGAALWLNQDRLRALLPETEVNRLLDSGDAALAQGRLVGADSASARYAEVLALDPDNTRAIEGRQRIGERLLVDARAALAAGDTARAAMLAAEARGALGGGDALATLDAEIESGTQRSAGLDALLAQARAAQESGRLAGAGDAALERYREALAIEPGNAVANGGIATVLDLLAQRARDAVRGGDVPAAAALLESIARDTPNHAALPELRAALADLEQQRARDEAAKQAADAEASRRRGVGLLVRAEAAIDADDPDAAERLLRDAARAGVPSAELSVARQRLAELRERREIAAQRSSDEQRRRAEALVAEAEAALASGQLIDPPGDNAYDKYRAALGADPRNARARDGLAALPDRARVLFAEALVQKRLGRARQYVDAIEAVRRGDPDLSRLKRELAAAHLAQAEQQIADGQYEGATRSVEKARELAPTEPAIATVEQKIRAARGS